MENTVKSLRRSVDPGMSQQQLGVLLGVSRATIATIEKGGKTSDEIVIKLAVLFDRDPREFFDASGVASNLQNALENWSMKNKSA